MDDRRLKQFIIESYLPGVTRRELNDADARLARATDELAAAGEPIRYLGSTFVPAEESFFSKFEGGSEACIRRACESARIPYARILAAKSIRSKKHGHETRAEGAMESARHVSPTLAARHARVSHDLESVAMPIRVLTNAEEQVARLAAVGHTDDEVASELGLTAAVVAAHLSQVFRKLGARSRDELPTLLPPISVTKEEE
jgi:DNA-binding CsgD family transcriptional regulator